MAAGRGFVLLLLGAAMAWLASAAAAAAFLSDRSTGRRSLLQAKKSCPVSFEFQNYTIITSKCKGPQYPVDACCGSFKEFACPYATYLNDESNDCASTMFSYINLYGKYPPGLFSSECKEGKLGLSCDGIVSKDSGVANHGQRTQSSSLGFITLVCGLASLLLH